MMCYRDKTFCSAECATTDCHRQFTERDRIGSEQWARLSGFESAPIAWSDFSTTCPKYKPAEATS